MTLCRSKIILNPPPPPPDEEAAAPEKGDKGKAEKGKGDKGKGKGKDDQEDSAVEVSMIHGVASQRCLKYGAQPVMYVVTS